MSFWVIATLLCPKGVFCKDAFEIYGDMGQFAIPILALLKCIAEEDREGSTQLFKTYSFSLGATYALKYTINSRRPNGGAHSFPSGHTASAFSGAWFLWRRYRAKYGVPSILASALVGVSRVHAKAHCWVDVVGSVALSAGFAFLFVSPRGVSLSFSW